MSLKRSQNGVVHYPRATRLQLRVHKALVGVLLKIRQVVAVVLVGMVDGPVECMSKGYAFSMFSLAMTCLMIRETY